MIVQTNTYVVPAERREDHARLMRKFRQLLTRLGCSHFEVHEQASPSWTPLAGPGRFLQIMRFRDRRHFQEVQAAERSDAAAQDLIREFCALINLPAQQESGTFTNEHYLCIATTLPEDAAEPARLPAPATATGWKRDADAAPAAPTEPPPRPAGSEPAAGA